MPSAAPVRASTGLSRQCRLSLAGWKSRLHRANPDPPEIDRTIMTRTAAASPHSLRRAILLRRRPLRRRHGGAGRHRRSRDQRSIGIRDISERGDDRLDDRRGREHSGQVRHDQRVRPEHDTGCDDDHGASGRRSPASRRVTTYHYQVRSVDAAGNVRASTVDRTFTTAAAPTTPTPPVDAHPACGGSSRGTRTAPCRFRRAWEWKTSVAPRPWSERGPQPAAHPPPWSRPWLQAES